MRKLVTAFALAVLAVNVGTSAQVNVAGTWQFVVELNLGSGEPTFEFKQDGETLTGMYEGAFGAAQVTGTVKGNRIRFRFGQEGAEAVYVGTIDGDTMSGTCDYGAVGEGTWEAERE